MSLKEKIVELEEERKDRVNFTMSFSEREFELMKEIEKTKKKNEINEMIITQLKKELEKYAYKII